MGKESICNAGDAEDKGSILGREDPLEKAKYLHVPLFGGLSIKEFTCSAGDAC